MGPEKTGGDSGAYMLQRGRGLVDEQAGDKPADDHELVNQVAKLRSDVQARRTNVRDLRGLIAGRRAGLGRH
jgi:hypothetical protein